MTGYEPLEQLVRYHVRRGHLPLARHEVDKVQAACAQLFRKYPALSLWNLVFQPRRNDMPAMVFIGTIAVSDKGNAMAGPFFRVNLRDGGFQATYEEAA